MLRLVHVLFGVQPRAQRQMPHIPPEWNEVSFSEAVTDSREVTPAALFVALAGERTDGHFYLGDVIARGARGALVSRAAVEARSEALAATTHPWVLVDPATGAGFEAAPPDACLLIAVDDPLMAVQRMAVYHRRQLTPTVVGITGSVGKTSTKEVVAAVLSRRFRTLKNRRSFNSEATVPTSILRLTAEHQAAVLEMGMWAPGEIRFLASLARPQVGIVTNVGPSHMERLGSIEAIAAAKAELPESLPADGWCILNADDPQVLAMAERTQARVLTYGFSATADVRAEAVQSFGLQGVGFTLCYADQRRELRSPLVGRHAVYLALSAAATGIALGMDLDAIVEGLTEPQDLDARIVRLEGPNGALIIDDTYNAAPLSVRAALDLLAEVPGRKIAVLGDMLELGAAEEAGHRDVGRYVVGIADLLVVVGRRARWIAEAALAAGMPAAQVQVFDQAEEAAASLRSQLQNSDVVLVKGSRGVEMERATALLRQSPEEE
ncbi:MAG: UDP-N-acetylmuramoyl-tripeptide--D-alanyl-D-alanine ligase [Oscillochloris sp.]|nr:UDP-N-acetylmuramoyl-tripeptide--D-alanyl-D-alanine ligase [Oscillochloris sp.]